MNLSRILSLVALTAAALSARSIEPPEPPALEAAYAHASLPATDRTLLNYRANGHGDLQAVVAASATPTVVGAWKSGMPGAGLPGFPAVLEMPESPAATPSLEFPNAAAAFGPNEVTVDLLVRFTRRDGVLLQIGEAARQWELVFLDQDGGTFALTIPMAAADGTVHARRREFAGVFERTGPIRRGEFHRLTLISDGRGAVRGLIDGIEAFAGTLAEPGETPAPLRGALRVGAATATPAAVLGLDFAEIRVERGDAPPALPTPIVRSPGKNGAGWRFDFGGAGSPVEPGWTPLAPTTAYTKEIGWGLLAPARDAFDFWFVADRWSNTPEQIIATKTRRARSWALRDGLEFDGGKLLRVDVPPGRYAVLVTVGHTTKSLRIERVEANGTSLGEAPNQKLRTVHNFYMRPNTRTARGLITVAAGEPLEISVTGEEEKGKRSPVAVLAVEILPIAALPEIPATFSPGREGAWEETATISDPVQRSLQRAAIIGRPEMTDARTLARLGTVHADLWQHLQRTPGDTAARYLLDLTDCARQAVLSFLHQPANGVLFGARKGRNWQEGIDHALRIQPGEPYFGHIRLLAGNLLWQSGQQSGGYLDEHTWRRNDRPASYAPPVAIFRQIEAAYPESQLARMFLGEKEPVEKQIAVPAGAPEWAALQHRAMVRILDVLHYWHHERAEPDGTMGGGLGDDVEMLRWWSLGVLVADDPGARDGWRKLAETVWNSLGRQAMSGARLNDAEHVAEDFADSHSLLPVVNVGTPAQAEAIRRSRSLYDILTRHIIQRNPQGYRMFRSHVYSARDIDKRDGDVPYNIRTLLPLIHHAFLHPEDREVVSLLADYARSWRDMTMQEIGGKPAGITPMMILFDRSSVFLPIGANNRLKRPADWVFPGYWTYEYPLGYTEHVYDLMLAAYCLTGDTALLDPHRKAAEFLRSLERDAPRRAEPRVVSAGSLATSQVSGSGPESAFPRGSLPWAIRINQHGLATAVEKYRLVTGDRSVDDVLRLHGSPYAQFQILLQESTDAAGRRRAVAPVEQALQVLMPELDYNLPFRTDLVHNTDRIWVQGSHFINSLATGLVSGEPPFSMRGAEIGWPLFGATWEQTGTDVSMLVSRNATDRFEVHLYGVQEGAKEIACRLWRLEAGDYEAALYPSPGFAADGRPAVFRRTFSVKARGERFAFALPGRTQHRLTVTKLPR